LVILDMFGMFANDGLTKKIIKKVLTRMVDKSSNIVNKQNLLIWKA
jgi:hypothetical protein